MAAVHALGHPNSPAPRTAWQPPELAHGGGSTAPAVTAAAAALPPNSPGIPVLTQGAGSDLVVTFNAVTDIHSVTAAAVQALMNQVSFSSTGPAGDRSVQFTVTQNDENSNHYSSA